MTSLPIDLVLPEIVAGVRAERRLVLVAPPGAGKTTRVAPAILRAGLLSAQHPNLVLLQPRRIAARAAAARIAEENGWTLGREVGYQVRFERVAGPETRLIVATEGILTRRLVADPFLEGTGAVLLDEFHERSLHTDLALALLREVRETVRDDLIVVVMSATLVAEPVAQFLGGCTIVRSEGRMYPVAVEHVPSGGEPMAERVAKAVLQSVGKAGPTVTAAESDPGHVLVFLPGWEEIMRVAKRLKPEAERAGWLVLPLHGRLSAEEQDRALRPSTTRKIVLATNVAETSLTIDGARTVIDSGQARQAGYDPVRGLDQLRLVRISRASADQRSGRAGRTGPGRCVRLWSLREERGMEPFDPPEIARGDLATTALALHAWGHSDPAKFAWLEPPPAESLAAAERLLAMLGAIEHESGPITALGRQLLALPAHPRLGRLLLAAAEAGQLRAGATLAALLAEKDILLSNVSKTPGAIARDAHSVRADSDLLVQLDLFEEAESARFAPSIRARGVDPFAARQVARARDALVRIGRSIRQTGWGSHDSDEPLRWVLLAYPDRVVRRRAAGGGETGVMVGGRGVRLDARSVVREADLFLALDPRDERDRRTNTREARVSIASAIKLEWLEELFPHALSRQRIVSFDEARQRAVAINRLYYRDLLLSEDKNAAVAPAEASTALGEALRARAGEIIRSNDTAATWLARVEFLRKAIPEAGWPTFDEATLAELVADACAGRATLDEVRKAPFVSLLAAQLSREQTRLLQTEAPETIAVPSGSKMRIEYPADSPPQISVRLQELFGWTEAPRLARGRVRMRLHLLGPNFRPVQITDDLASFWANTYAQVRKDLRARYPRHAWPEDPLNAKPEAKGGARRGKD